MRFENEVQMFGQGFSYAAHYREHTMLSISAASRTISGALLQLLFGITILLLLLIGNASAQNRSVTDGSTPLALAPGAPAGSYALSGFDNINPYNGNLNFRLPLYTIGGRGEAQYTMMLPIEQHWTVKHSPKAGTEGTSFNDFPQYNVWNGLRPGYGPAALTGRQVNDGACGTVSNGLRVSSSLTRLTFITPDGTEYELLDQLTGGAVQTSYCNSANAASRGTVFKTVDGTAATFVSDITIYDTFAYSVQIYPSGYLMLRNGFRYRIDGGRVSWMRDRNGNQVNFAYSNSALTITDSLNRQTTVAFGVSDVAPYGVCDQITFKGFGGAQRMIRVSYTNLGNALRAGYSLQTYAQLFPELNAASSYSYHDPSVVSAVWLPNGQRYQFFYNSYGELARVVLPTGGAYEYDFGPGTVNGYASGVIYVDSCGGTGASEIYRRVIEKRVYSDGSTLESRMTFGRPEDNLGGNLGYVVTDRLSSAGTLLARERSSYYGRATQSFNLCPFDYAPWQDGREYQTEALSGDGTSVLRRVTHTWQNASNLLRADSPRIIETVNTLVDSNQVAKESAVNPQTGAVSFDQFNNQTDTWDYDYGLGSPGPLLRRTHTDYANSTNLINGLDYTTTDIHLRSLPIQQQVFDASGILRAQTSYEYDNYTQNGSDAFHNSLVPRSDISGLDSSFTTTYYKRGNATKTTRYLLDASGNVANSINSYAQYDVAGNVVKIIDARSMVTNIIATTFDFSDRFGAPDGEARSNSAPTELSSQGQSSYAFATLVTSPPPQIGQPQQTAYAQFDYYLGRPVDGEDANGVVSSGYSESEPLDRPTKVIRAANQNSAFKSQTLFSYDDVNRTVTTTSDFNSFNDSNPLKSQVLYDGLGRTTETRHYETASNYIAGQQRYDPLGRVYQASNPFRPWNGENPVWTTTGFDALSRIISVTTADGSVATSSYIGNAVTVTDQNGKSRKSVSDALGRLTSVYEDPNGLNYVTNYSYDVLGDLLAVNQGTQPRTFVYDSLKRLLSATNPENGTVAFDYDNNGNLLHRTDARNITTTIVYDALNRPTSKTYQNDPANTPPVTYFYDNQSLPTGAPSFTHGPSVGRLVAVTYGNNSSAGDYYGFDAIGRTVLKIQQTGGINYQVSASYNVSGALVSETYPSGHTVNYAFDLAGRLNSFTGNLGDNTTRTYSLITGSNAYDAAGHLTQEQFGTATPIYNKLAYNTRGQLAEMRASTAGGDDSFNRGKIVNDYSDQCSGASCNGSDNNGNLKKQTVFIPNNDQNTSPTSWNQQYGYDSLNRLTQVHEYTGNTQLDWQQAYNYDRWGNRTIDIANTSANIPRPAFNVDTNTNRLTVPGGQSGTMAYDNAGNLTTETYSAAAVTRAYDAENRMTSETQVNNYVAGSYSYDGDGRRVKRTVNGTTTWQVYGFGGELLAEYAQNAAASSPQKEYGYRNGQLLVTLTVAVGGSLSFTDDPLQAGSTVIKAIDITELRDAVNQARVHAGLVAATWTDTQLSGVAIKGVHITELRARLDEARAALGLSAASYTDSNPPGVAVKAVHITELRASVQEAQSAIDIRWLVSDQLGTPRMVFDQSGSLANVSRHDYLPFGEELFAGQGGRTQAQGYTLSDNVRQKFTQKERDNETGLDYFINRYYSSTQGRFTSVDPIKLTPERIFQPQRLNLYSYTINNPLNLIDPDGKDIDFINDTKEGRRKALLSITANMTAREAKNVGVRWNKDSQKYEGYVKNASKIDLGKASQGYQDFSDRVNNHDLKLNYAFIGKNDSATIEINGVSTKVTQKSLAGAGGDSTGFVAPQSDGSFAVIVSAAGYPPGVAGLTASGRETTIAMPNFMLAAHELFGETYKYTPAGTKEGLQDNVIDDSNKVIEIENKYRDFHGLPHRSGTDHGYIHGPTVTVRP